MGNITVYSKKTKTAIVPAHMIRTTPLGKKKKTTYKNTNYGRKNGKELLDENETEEEEGEEEEEEEPQQQK